MRAVSAVHQRLLRLVLGALFGALLFVSQVVLAPLPNIEVVTLFIIVWTRVFRQYAAPGIAVFVLLEGLLYGFGIWFISYLYIWFILWGIVMLLPGAVPAEPRRIVISTLLWAVVAGAYGMAFGALTAIPWLARGGWKTAVAYTVSGLPFDVTHMIANFCLALVLATPLTLLLTRLNDLLAGKKKTAP